MTASPDCCRFRWDSHDLALNQGSRTSDALNDEVDRTGLFESVGVA